MRKLSIAFSLLFVFAVAVSGQTAVESHINRSHDLDQEGKFEEAIAEIGRAIAIEPRNSLLYLKRAQIINNQQIVLQTYDFKLSTPDLLKTVELDPDTLQTYLTAIHLLLRNQISGPALQVANQAVLRFPSEASVFSERARARTYSEDFPGAMADIERAISLDPLSDMLKHFRANLLRLMDRKEDSVVSYTEQITSMELRLQAGEELDGFFAFNLAGAYISRSRILARNGEIEKAFADLNRAVEVHPIHYTYQIRARAYKSEKKYPEALADIDEAMRKDPENASLLIDRGDILVLMESYDEAIKAFEFAINSGNIRPVDFIERRITLAREKMGEKPVPVRPE